MAERIALDTRALKGYISQYKQTFNMHRLGEDNEIYKWKAVKCFQDNWDINKVDLPAIMRDSFALTKNLLAMQNNFPVGMIDEFAKVAPDDVRSMFRDLFDENVDLIRRVNAFEKRSEELRQLHPEQWKSHYQTPNAINTYLWLRYPDKYYIYKYSVMKDVAQKICGAGMPPGKYDRMMYGYALFDAVCEMLAKDSELVEMSKESLTKDCYPDDALKTLTIDMGYFISVHSGKDKYQVPPIAPEASMFGNLFEQQKFPKNILLYGTPGTGKTYSTVLYAVSIVEEKPLATIKAEEYGAVFKRYQKYKEDGLVAFTTFHQSFGYEEFIEGIRPVVSADDNPDNGKDIAYEIRDRMFKEFCDKAGMPIGVGN